VGQDVLRDSHESRKKRYGINSVKEVFNVILSHKGPYLQGNWDDLYPKKSRLPAD
jgi:hypothetical protein